MAELTQKDIQQLNKVLEDLTRVVAGARSPSSSSSSSRPGGSFSTGGGGTYQRLRDQMKDAESGMKQLAKGSSLLGAAALKSAKHLSNTRQLVLMQDLLEKGNKLLKDEMYPNLRGMARSMKLLKDDADEFREGLESADFARLSMNVGAASETLSKANKKAEQLIKEIEAQIGDSGRASIAKIRAGGGSAMAQVAKIQKAGILGIDSDANALPGKVGADLAALLSATAAELKQQGNTNEALNASGEDLIDTFDKLAEETEEINKLLVKTVRDHALAIGGLTNGMKLARAKLYELGESALAAVAALGSFNNFKAKATDTFSEMMGFNVSHVADNFLNLQVQSIRLGMSFKDTVALYQQNARLLAVQGKGSFQSSLANLKDTFNAYGYTFEQGSKMLAPAIENAVLSGVNVRDQGAVSDYMKQTLHNAQLMATVTGRMPEDIIKVQQSLLQSESVFNTMAGMDKQRRAAYAKEMLQTVDRMVLDGMEYEQAAEVLKIQQQVARAPVREKVQKAAMGMNASRIAGMSAEDSRRLFKLEMQTGYSPAEQQELARLQTMRAQGMEAGLQAANARTGNNALAFLNMQQTVGSNIFGADVAKIGMQAQLRKDAGLGLTPEQAETQRQAAAGNAKLAALGQIVDQVSSVMKNSLVSSSLAAALGLGGVAVSALKVMLAFNKMTGAPLLGGRGGSGGGGGVLGKIGKYGGRLGAGGLAGLALGLGGGALGDSIGGTAGSMLSSAAKWGSIGLSAGSLFGPMGALLAGGAGALAGGAYGYFTSPGSTSAPGAVNTEALAAESMKGLSGSSLTVVDAVAHAHLQTIAASMNEAVQLLRVLTTTGGTASQRAGSAIPNAAQYVTGNG